MQDTLHDYLILDGTQEAEDSFEYYAALQRQINNGTVWHMQGSMGRAAMDAIKSGRCVCGHLSAPDYFGNVVPSRTQLQDGTFGTVTFAAEHCGADWADRIAAV